MSTKKDDILKSKFNQYMKAEKTSCIIYAYLESLIKKIGHCTNNPEISSATKIGKHTPSRYLMPAIWAFENIEDKYSLYHGKDCMEEFCISLREHAANVICRKNFTQKLTRDKDYR